MARGLVAPQKLVRPLSPSFETPDSRAPPDEESAHILILRSDAEHRVSKDGTPGRLYDTRIE
jgi:hypothetical protein